MRVGGGQVLATRGLSVGGVAVGRAEGAPAECAVWESVPDTRALVDPYLLAGYKFLQQEKPGRWLCACTQVLPFAPCLCLGLWLIRCHQRVVRRRCEVSAKRVRSVCEVGAK